MHWENLQVLQIMLLSTEMTRGKMGIPVKLEVFEGPLDLLLHLIEKNKVDIYDIPIVEITNQYMEYIRGCSMKI